MFNINSYDNLGKIIMVYPKPKFTPESFDGIGKKTNSLLNGIKPCVYKVGQRSPEIINIKKILNKWLPDGLHLDGYNGEKGNPENDEWTQHVADTVEVITVAYGLKNQDPNRITTELIEIFKKIINDDYYIKNAEGRRLRNLVRMYVPEVGLTKFKRWKEVKDRKTKEKCPDFNYITRDTLDKMAKLAAKYNFNLDALIHKVSKEEKRNFNLEVFFAAIVKASEIFDIDPVLICALIKRESQFDCDYDSMTGDIGLTQITPVAVEELSNNRKKCKEGSPYLKVKDYYYAYLEYAYEIEKNILLGTAYLRYMFDHYGVYENKKTYYCGRNYRENNALIRAIAAYNRGTKNIKKDTNTEDLRKSDHVGTIFKNYEYYREGHVAEK